MVHLKKKRTVECAFLCYGHAFTDYTGEASRAAKYF